MRGIYPKHNVSAYFQLRKQCKPHWKDLLANYSLPIPKMFIQTSMATMRRLWQYKLFFQSWPCSIMKCITLHDYRLGWQERKHISIGVNTKAEEINKGPPTRYVHCWGACFGGTFWAAEIVSFSSGADEKGLHSLQGPIGIPFGVDASWWQREWAFRLGKPNTTPSFVSDLILEGDWSNSCGLECGNTEKSSRR